MILELCVDIWGGEASNFNWSHHQPKKHGKKVSFSTEDIFCMGSKRSHYQANFATHHTSHHHVSFLLTWHWIGKRNKMSRYFLSNLYHNTKLYQRDKNISTHWVEILLFCEINQKFKRFPLFFCTRGHTKRKPSGGAKTCSYRCVPRHANSL